MITTITKQELKDVLMDPRALGVKESYYILDADDQAITILMPGKNGIEFNKTMGYFHKYQGMEIYQCLYGQGVLIMQRNDELGEAKEFRIVTLQPGRQVEVPAGWGHCFVNIGKNLLVIVGNSLSKPKERSTHPLEEKRGFAYYIVEKKGEIGFEQNPNYRVHPQITT